METQKKPVPEKLGKERDLNLSYQDLFNELVGLQKLLLEIEQLNENKPIGFAQLKNYFKNLTPEKLIKISNTNKSKFNLIPKLSGFKILESVFKSEVLPKISNALIEVVSKKIQILEEAKIINLSFETYRHALDLIFEHLEKIYNFIEKIKKAAWSSYVYEKLINFLNEKVKIFNFEAKSLIENIRLAHTNEASLLSNNIESTLFYKKQKKEHDYFFKEIQKKSIKNLKSTHQGFFKKNEPFEISGELSNKIEVFCKKINENFEFSEKKEIEGKKIADNIQNFFRPASSIYSIRKKIQT